MPDTRTNPRERRSLGELGFLLWLLPLAVWALAVGYWGFDLGKYSDDWSQTLISPDTGRIDWGYHPWVRWPFFFRPLYFVVVWSMNTAFWDMDRVRHLLAAMAHLGVGVMLWRLLRRIGFAAAPAIGAAMVFLAWPVHYEAVLWPAAIGIPLGTLCFLLVTERMVGFATQAPDGRPWGRAAAMGLLTFTAACLHEQPAACVAALPALYLACRPRTQPLSAMARRLLVSVGACGLACVLYAALLVGTAPPGRRGSGSSIVALAHADERLGSFARQAGSWLGGSRFVRVSIEPALEGARQIASSPVGLMWGIAIAACLVAWLLAFPLGWDPRWQPPGEHEGSRPSHPGVRWAWILVFGVAVALFGLVPIAVTRNNAVFSRYFYTVSLGGAIALAAALERARFVRPRWSGLVASILLAALGVWGACAMVAWQGAFHRRSAMDRTIGDGLRAAYPDLPLDAVLVPMSIAPPLSGPASSTDIPGALAQPWACWAFVQHTLRRSDLTSSFCRPGIPPPLAVESVGVRAKRGVCDRWGRPDPIRAWFPWELAAPFEVDADGHVRPLGADAAAAQLRERAAGR